ncbi:MAG TPA: MBL fold metallo-hydrolase [Actinomycetota bacterium]|nr:MBL fold metallo-hydrolase [Actinomycetota bacterium]
MPGDETSGGTADAPSREVRFTDIGDGISMADLRTGGLASFNASFLIAAREPALVESGPAADADDLTHALAAVGIDPGELAHVVVTHVHLDHAGGAGALLRRFPRAILWVHEAGARHLADPERLIASTARTYGEDRMRSLYGETVPVPRDRIEAVVDGQAIALGDRSLEVLHTPGHASHHVALMDGASGAMFTGEATGSYLPWADAYRPALPPPEVDVDAALASIGAIRRRQPSRLLVTHFGPIDDAEEGLRRGAERIEAWAETVRRRLEREPDASDEELVELLTEQAREEYATDSGQPFEHERYDAIGSIAMNVRGLARYWRKRWEREGRPEPS